MGGAKLLHSAAVLWLLAMAGGAQATYFAFSRDAGQIVVAIDSRQVDTAAFGRLVQRDDQCKLFPLGENGLFFASGLIENSDPRAAEFDGSKLAQTLFAANPTNVEEVARRWASQMVVHLSELRNVLPELFHALQAENIVNAYFVGFDHQAELQMVTATVRQESQLVLGTIVRPAPFGVSFGGHAREAQEYTAVMTSRSANARNNALRSAMAFDDPLNRLAVVLREAVQVIPGWANDPSSGGDVAVAIVTASPPSMRWFHRPDGCN